MEFLLRKFSVCINLFEESEQLSRYSDGLYGRGSIHGMAGYFFLLHSVQTGSGAHPVSYQMCTMSPHPGSKAREREANYSSPSSTEIMNSGAIPSLFHTSLLHSA
jgi:hypothetical protein